MTDSCYYRNGTVVPSPYLMLPCSSPNPTICCGLGRAKPPGSEFPNNPTPEDHVRDECLPNGLCQNRHVMNGIPMVAYWLLYCTDANITSGNCLDVCKETRDIDGGSPMTPCDGTSSSELWCCGLSNKCCRNSFAVVKLPKTFGRSVPLITSSKSSTSTPSPFSTLFVSTIGVLILPTTAPVVDSGFSTETKVGIGIGAIAGVFVLFVGMGIFMWKVLERKIRASMEKDRAGESVGDVTGEDLHEKVGDGICELQQPLVQLPTKSDNVELSS
ncbi:hypothetical protein P280DRAFT_108663 [Massarina eburnea CBS 473.64]|uniref:Mid2 domain-containing protein n=1 Tax=Massarina eburnea CBS 473.64 TaxID=1395130 RepID=A0A6A6RTJ3_9PLEO|nr:hypothetical protein P280DRAFT_108663 [Massarina eburnea CBS 473.64]